MSRNNEAFHIFSVSPWVPLQIIQIIYWLRILHLWIMYFSVPRNFELNKLDEFWRGSKRMNKINSKDLKKYQWFLNTRRGTQREILRKRPKNNNKAWIKFSETMLSILGDCWKKIICSSLPARLMEEFPASNLTTCNLTYWEVYFFIGLNSDLEW